ncbi:unnamed protein product [Cylicocyclus nassatus]|uniref:Serpentine receptor class gamma n=1 Tax=Cylicocyclus nassatus TaxID=53992 RepID=A0AA36H7C7_CYLNA|nr:unnamed protein product [Cylicocyclus nassatus]
MTHGSEREDHSVGLEQLVIIDDDPNDPIDDPMDDERYFQKLLEEDEQQIEMEKAQVVVMWCFDMSTTRFLGIGYFCKELLFSWGTPSWEISIVQFIMTYSRHAQFYAATVLSINRMTAVLVPVAYNESSVTFTTLFVALICAFTILICSAITYFKLTCRRNRFRCTKVDRVLLVVGLTSSLTTFTLALVEVPLYITINFGTLSRDHFFIATMYQAVCH